MGRYLSVVWMLLQYLLCDDAVVVKQQLCKNSKGVELHISCGSGHVIGILDRLVGKSAHWRDDGTTCPDSASDCFGETFAGTIKCQGSGSCTLNSGDIELRTGTTQTCADVNYMIVIYECIPVSSMHSVCTDATWRSQSSHLVSDDYPRSSQPVDKDCVCHLTSPTPLNITVHFHQLNFGSAHDESVRILMFNFTENVTLWQNLGQISKAAQTITVNDTNKRISLQFTGGYPNGDILRGGRFWMEFNSNSVVQAECSSNLISAPPTTITEAPSVAPSSTVTSSLREAHEKSTIGPTVIDSNNTAPIIGGAVAGVCALVAILVAVAIWRYRRRDGTDEPTVQFEPFPQPPPPLPPMRPPGPGYEIPYANGMERDSHLYDDLNEVTEGVAPVGVGGAVNSGVHEDTTTVRQGSPDGDTEDSDDGSYDDITAAHAPPNHNQRPESDIYLTAVTSGVKFSPE